MAIQVHQTFSESQIKAIITFQNKLKKMTKRNISLAEAITNWIALGYAEEYRNGYFFQDAR